MNNSPSENTSVAMIGNRKTPPKSGSSSSRLFRDSRYAYYITPALSCQQKTNECSDIFCLFVEERRGSPAFPFKKIFLLRYDARRAGKCKIPHSLNQSFYRDRPYNRHRQSLPPHERQLSNLRLNN